MSSPEFTEEELRQIQAEMERITVDDVLLQTVVTLLNLAARKAGVGHARGRAAPARPRAAARAIDGARALLPLLDEHHGDKLGPVRDTLSQLQMVYAQLSQGGGGAAGAGRSGRHRRRRSPAQPEGPGAAQSSGRLLDSGPVNGRSA